jgi:hypothetical protein
MPADRGKQVKGTFWTQHIRTKIQGGYKAESVVAQWWHNSAMAQLNNTHGTKAKTPNINQNATKNNLTTLSVVNNPACLDMLCQSTKTSAV